MDMRNDNKHENGYSLLNAFDNSQNKDQSSHLNNMMWNDLIKYWDLNVM